MEKKEFAVGEVFQFGLKKLKVVESSVCGLCALWLECHCLAGFYSCKFVGRCAPSARTDGKSVVFVEVKDEK